jgi:hypothetical protein
MFKKNFTIFRGEPRGEQEIAANPKDDGVRLYDGKPAKPALAQPDLAPITISSRIEPDMNLDALVLGDNQLPPIEQVIGLGDDENIPAPAPKPSQPKAKPLPKGFKPLS